MATANALKGQELKHKARELEETKRHNKKMERLGTAQAIIGGVTGAATGFGSVGKGLQALSNVGKGVKAANDPSWYKLNPVLSERASRLAFNVTSGLHYSVPDQTVIGTPQVLPAGAVHSDITLLGTGVCAMEYLSTIGGSAYTNDLTNSPFIQVCRRLMSAVRTAIGPGPKSYDDINLGMTMFVVGEAYAFIEYIKRGLRIVQTFAGANRSYGEMLAAACGYDYASFLYNMNDGIKALNSAIVQLNSCPIPDDFSLVLRHSWMNSTVFKDSESDKAQLYVFRPKCYFTYDDINSKVVANILFPYHTPRTYTFDTLMGYLQNILTSVLDSSDVALMRGDLAIAYAKSGNALSGRQLKYSLITELSPLVPEYIPEVLEQIHNATIVGANSHEDSDAYSISELTVNHVNYAVQGWPFQNNGAADNVSLNHPNTTVLSVIPCGLQGGLQSPTIMFLNTREQSPDEDTVLVDSRLKVLRDWVSNSEFKPGITDTGGAPEGIPFIDSCGTEVIYDLGFYHRAGSNQAITIGALHGSNFVLATTGTFAGYMSLFSQFDWLPMLDVTDPTFASQYYYGDVNNFALFSKQWLRDIHLTCIYSLFGVKFDT